MRFVECFKVYCEEHGTSPHKAAQSVGEDTKLISDWINGKRNPTPDRMMTLLKNFSHAEVLDIDFPTLAYWWARDYIPQESFLRAFAQLEKENPELVRQAREIKKKRKEEGGGK